MGIHDTPFLGVLVSALATATAFYIVDVYKYLLLQILHHTIRVAGVILGSVLLTYILLLAFFLMWQSVMRLPFLPTISAVFVVALLSFSKRFRTNFDAILTRSKLPYLYDRMTIPLLYCFSSGAPLYYIWFFDDLWISVFYTWLAIWIICADVLEESANEYSFSLEYIFGVGIVLPVSFWQKTAHDYSLTLFLASAICPLGIYKFIRTKSGRTEPSPPEPIPIILSDPVRSNKQDLRDKSQTSTGSQGPSSVQATATKSPQSANSLTQVALKKLASAEDDTQQPSNAAIMSLNSIPRRAASPVASKISREDSSKSISVKANQPLTISKEVHSSGEAVQATSILDSVAASQSDIQTSKVHKTESPQRVKVALPKSRNPTYHEDQAKSPQKTKRPLIKSKKVQFGQSNTKESNGDDFKYTPLKEFDEIRILTILPSTSQSETIHCEIENSMLKDCVRTYKALSYEWGAEENKVSIRIRAKGEEKFWALKVTRNLSSGLRQLRASDISRLWIDAICIDQHNSEEMGAQMKRMFDIYGKASEVLVWLGEGSESLDRVMDKLKSNEYSDVKSREYSGREKNDINTFLTLSYWQRLWIVQEIAAGLQIALHCGKKVAPLDNMRDLALFWHPQSRDGTFDSMASKVFQVREKRKTESNISLLKAIEYTWRSKSKHRRDKVYGLLGLAYDSHQYVEYVNPHIKDDELCLSMTALFIEKTAQLDIILHGTKLRPGLLELPSWCPDYLYYRPEPLSKLMTKYLSMDQRTRFGKQIKKWKAAGTSLAETTQVPRDGKLSLVVRGHCIGRITGLSSTIDEGPEGVKNTLHDVRKTVPEEDREIFNSLNRLLFMYYNQFELATAYPTYLPLLFGKPWWRYEEVITGPLVDWSWKLTDRKMPPRLQSWIKNNEGMSMYNATLGSRSIIKHGAFQLVLHYQSCMSSILSYNAAEQNICKAVLKILEEKMRLMITDQLNIGWVHPDAQLDDKVFLVAGCSLPVILREYLDGYQVVGHAYIDGVMNGEKWAKLEPYQRRQQHKLY